jgi:hypothetical protein
MGDFVFGALGRQKQVEVTFWLGGEFALYSGANSPFDIRRELRFLKTPEKPYFMRVPAVFVG